MSSGVFVGIDHGGTTTTAPVLDLEKGKRSSHSGPVPKRMLQPGGIEHDPEDFLETTLASALGAAYLSAIGAGQLSVSKVTGMQREVKTYEPSMTSDERESLWNGWWRSVNAVCERVAP